MAERNKRLALYMLSVALATLGVSYASVPLYKLFCQATGFGGTTQRVDAEQVRDLSPVCRCVRALGSSVHDVAHV